MSSESVWENRFTAMVNLFQKMDWKTNTQTIFQQMANELVSIVGCDSVSIRLLSMAGDEMVGYVFAGGVGELARMEFPTLPRDLGRMTKVFEELQPVVYNFNAPQEGDAVSKEGQSLGYSHSVTVPLVAGESLVGTIDFMFKEGEFNESPEFVHYLTELGRMLGPVTNALNITDSMVELRVSEEAQRIGSELHDNFAQPLSVIALEADKAMLAREDGDNESLDESLQKITSLSHQSSSVMANEVALLHSASGTAKDLTQDITRYVDSFKNQWGMDIGLKTPAQEVLVSSAVGNQAMRILHEALSNVLRHAKAKKVVVTLASDNGAVELNIEDDGCGFDVHSLSSKQLGLRIMEERAESIGGKLTLASVIDEGTSVFADLPLIALS